MRNLISEHLLKGSAWQNLISFKMLQFIFHVLPALGIKVRVWHFRLPLSIQYGRRATNEELFNLMKVLCPETYAEMEKIKERREIKERWHEQSS